MYLSSQLFLKTPHETLKLLKNPRKIHFRAIYRPKFQNFPLLSTTGAPYGATELRKK